MQTVRWTMCATDRCFKSRLLAPFFKAAKVRALCMLCTLSTREYL